MEESRDGRRRVVVEGVAPQVDGGRFPVKRIVGEPLTVEADVFADSHDEVAVRLLHRSDETEEWSEVPMEPIGNDRWRGRFVPARSGLHLYTLLAWVDRFGTWRRDLLKKIEADADALVDYLVGVELLEEATVRAKGADQKALQGWARRLQGLAEASLEERRAGLLASELVELMAVHLDRRFATRYGLELEVVVDRPRARFGAWYELFPRSCSRQPEKHGSFEDVEAQLSYVASMGFDVLYLPPIHPIGLTHRKGKNNATVATSEDPGSPWAIGSEDGGHKAVHPELGTLKDFDHLVSRAREHDLEIALDIAFQCSPDHPYVKDHPEWFRWRPDGTVQYAENPPKKYEDIFPFDFETQQWRELWEELKSVFLFWAEHGVRIFRVDNPHTKPFAFWEWLIPEVKREHPDAIFLAEAFTRPAVMYRLAKVGFTQSYTYFTWRNSREELTEYFRQLTRPPLCEFFRPNLWPNTPDILTEYLQAGGRPAFMVRLVLAATLGASYGIYGPAFELCERRPREPGSEEYLHSEKYEIKEWDLQQAGSLRGFVGKVNRLRKAHPALHGDRSLRFHATDNDQLLAYSKRTADGSDVVLVIVNLDPHHVQRGWTELDLGALGVPAGESFQVHDLLEDERYIWQGPRNYVELSPERRPAHVFAVRRQLRSERDFEYYL